MPKHAAPVPIDMERVGTFHLRARAMGRVLHSVQAGPLSKRAFKSQIECSLSWAFAAWIRLALAAINPCVPEDREAWEEMAGQVEYEFAGWYLHPIAGQFDRAKAARQALANLRKDEKDNHQFAITLMKEKYSLRNTGPLPRKKIREFFDWVTAVMETIELLEHLGAIKAPAKKRPPKRRVARRPKRKAPKERWHIN